MSIFSKWFSNKESESPTSVEPKRPQLSAADYCEQGQKSLDAGKYVEAMEYFQAAIEADNRFEKAHLLLATAYEKQGKMDLAKAALYGLLAIDPNNEKALERIEVLKGVALTETTINANGNNKGTHQQPQTVQAGNYRIFDGEPEDRFDFFIIFDDGNRLFFKKNNGCLSTVAPSKTEISFRRFVLDWNGYKEPEGSLVIPETIEYKGETCPVTIIGERAFYYCEKLKSIQIPQSILRIDDMAFYACTSLHSIQLPHSLESIGKECFRFCTFKTIDIPDSVTSIGEYAFGSCKNLTVFRFPKQMISIKEGVLACCISLNTIIVPCKVKEIANYSFGDWILGGSSSVHLIMETTNPPKIGDSIFGGMNKTIKVKVSVPAGSLENYITAQYWQLFDIVEK